MIEATTSTGTSNGLTVSKGQEQKSQFLQLLVAQLKGQDPMNPMDGTQFASQLAQFSSLEELINIRDVMQNVDTTLQNQQGYLEQLAPSQDPGINPFSSGNQNN